MHFGFVRRFESPLPLQRRLAIVRLLIHVVPRRPSGVAALAARLYLHAGRYMIADLVGTLLVTPVGLGAIYAASAAFVLPAAYVYAGRVCIAGLALQV